MTGAMTNAIVSYIALAGGIVIGLALAAMLRANEYRQRRQGKPVTDIDQMLAERGQRYGDFAGHAAVTQRLKRSLRDSPRWDALSDGQQEALEMIAHKIGRILNGDPNYADNWADLAGYARLVEQRLAPPEPEIAPEKKRDKWSAP